MREMIKVFEKKLVDTAPDAILIAGTAEDDMIIFDRILSTTLYRVPKAIMYKDVVYKKEDNMVLNKSLFSGEATFNMNKVLLPLIIVLNFKEDLTDEQAKQTVLKLKSLAKSIGEHSYDSVQLTKGLAMLARTCYVTLIMSARGYNKNYINFYTTNLHKYFEVTHLAPAGSISVSIKGRKYSYVEPMSALELDAKELITNVKNF